MRATMRVQSEDLYLGERRVGRREIVQSRICRKRHISDQQTQAEEDQDAPVATEEPATRLAQRLRGGFSCDRSWFGPAPDVAWPEATPPAAHAAAQTPSPYFP